MFGKYSIILQNSEVNHCFLWEKFGDKIEHENNSILLEFEWKTANNEIRYRLLN